MGVGAGAGGDIGIADEVARLSVVALQDIGARGDGGGLPGRGGDVVVDRDVDIWQCKRLYRQILDCRLVAFRPTVRTSPATVYISSRFVA